MLGYVGLCMAMQGYVGPCMAQCIVGLFMAMQGHVGQCRVKGYVGLCIAMQGCVWLCRVVYGYLGLCMAMQDYVGLVGLCRAMYGYVGLCMAMQGYILTNVKPLYDAYTMYLPSRENRGHTCVWRGIFLNLLQIFSLGSGRQGHFCTLVIGSPEKRLAGFGMPFHHRHLKVT